MAFWAQGVACLVITPKSTVKIIHVSHNAVTIVNPTKHPFGIQDDNSISETFLGWLSLSRLRRQLPRQRAPVNASIDFFVTHLLGFLYPT